MLMETDHCKTTMRMYRAKIGESKKNVVFAVVVVENIPLKATLVPRESPCRYSILNALTN
jgi:hypothetical protein